MGIENRRHERIDSQWLVHITDTAGSEVREATCLNLSEGGLFVQMPEPPPKGSTLRLELRLDPMDETVRVDGTVVRVLPEMPDSPIRPGVGMRFEGMSDTTRDLIREALADQTRTLPQLPISREQKP